MLALNYDVLKTKNKQELFYQINATKRKMLNLKRKMENNAKSGDNSLKVCVCPSPLTMYKYDRFFLQKAIEKYVRLGGVYKRSRREIADETFNSNINNISKIIFTRGANGGFLDDARKTVVMLSGEEIKVEKGNGNYLYPYQIYYTKSGFLNSLSELHLGEWKFNYVNALVCDGEFWNLTIIYANNKQVEYEGLNAYPYNFNELLLLLHEEYCTFCDD